MREFNYIQNYGTLLTPEIVALLSQIHEHKGALTLVAETNADTLTQLVEIAKIQSTEASNRIEGICTSDKRLRKLVLDKTKPQTRSEHEIAGYRDVLNTIHENHPFIPPKPSVLLQLHRDLYKFSVQPGGNYKITDNVIEETDETGRRFVRFAPVSAWETSEAVDRLCRALEDTLNESAVDPLLVIPMFILDFLCIHPFGDGNGRMSRLLTLLLLYRAGYDVGKYVSIEKLIEQSKDSYYEALYLSDQGWHENKNNYLPFIRYYLGVILAAYREFDERARLLTAAKVSKPDRIRSILQEHLGKITKSELMAQCPDISQVTIQRTLNELVKSGEVIKLGGGRYTSYTWNRE